MKRILLLTLMVVLLIPLTSCLDFLNSGDDEKDNPLIGNWIMYRYVDYWGDYDYSETYNPEIDNYFDAYILEFTKDIVTEWENDSGTDYWADEYDYELQDDKIIVDGDEYSYSIQDDILIIGESDDDYQEYYKKYNGDLPPASWTQELQADSYEPDDSYTETTVLTVNADPQTHTFTDDNEDWFSFDATANQSYLIVVGSHRDMYIELYDTDGSSYLDDDDDNDYDIELNDYDFNVESVLYWTAPAAGTYYIRIDAYSYNEGYYVISVMETTMASPFAKAVTTDSKDKKSSKSQPFLKRH